MSFSVTFKLPPDKMASGAFEAADIPNKDAAVTAGGELLTEALAFADGLAGYVAKDDEAVQVSISGHWNGDFEPKSGWASNMLTISVTQIYNPAKE
jgi:hypothetical protein